MSTNEPWYKKWGLAILAGLGMVLAGLALAFTGGKRGRSVSSVEKKMRDIHDDELTGKIVENVKTQKKLEEEKEDLRKVAEQAHRKLKEAPKYDKSKSDKENLEVFKNSKW